VEEVVRSRIGLRAIAAFQASVLLLALAALAHHRAAGPHAAWFAPAATCDAAVATPAASERAAGDRHDCLLCRAGHARWLPDAVAPVIVRPRGAHVARIALPDDAAPAAAVDLLTAPKTSPPA
jgi:hypothetical protein